MKKLTFALLAVATFAANASNTYSVSAASGEACGAAAELAVTVADVSRDGMSWAEVDAIMQKTYQNFGPRTREASTSIIREAYYSWNSFSDSTVRSLAYNKCMAEVVPAVRADMRTQ